MRLGHRHAYTMSCMSGCRSSNAALMTEQTVRPLTARWPHQKFMELPSVVERLTPTIQTRHVQPRQLHILQAGSTTLQLTGRPVHPFSQMDLLTEFAGRVQQGPYPTASGRAECLGLQTESVLAVVWVLPRVGGGVHQKRVRLGVGCERVEDAVYVGLHLF
jgi:hypothetical protein